MLNHRSYRRGVMLLLLTFLTSWLPSATPVPWSSASVPVASAAAESQPVTPPVQLTATPFVDPHLPSLTTQIAITPDPIAVGETAAFTITVTNDAPDPAQNLVVTLPTPDGALANAGPNTINPVQGWQWTLVQLDGHSAASFSGSLRVVRQPRGDALLLALELTAQGMTSPLHDQAGALIVDRTHDRSATPFAPGQAARMQSSDGTVTVDVPGQAFGRALTLSHVPEWRKFLELRAGNLPIPPALVGHRRGLGMFFLEATDAAGADVHQFGAPLTISVAYTPEQLQSRGIAEADLTLFWFDAEAVDASHPAGQWLPIPTTLDIANHTARATVNHFTPFQLGDGSSPSEAFIPTLQGWQVSTYTGAASYSYGIDVPAGPAGIKPSLSLSYSSAATDGASGTRLKQQAGWVGKGWSLDTGSVSAGKLKNGTLYYTLVFNGQSFDLVRGAALSGNTGVNDNNPTHWEWHPTDESFIRVQAVSNGTSFDHTAAAVQNTVYDIASSDSAYGRGGVTTTSAGGTWQNRYLWRVWTKDGTLYEFSEDLWWGWDSCANALEVQIEPYKWLLSKVQDTHTNTINYEYNRQVFIGGTLNCGQGRTGRATIDRDAWLTRVSWANDHYQVVFGSSQRANNDDTQYENSDNQYAGAAGTPHQTRRLNTIAVSSKPTGTSWQLIGQYNLGYDTSLTPDALSCTSTSCSAQTGYPKLTLKSIQRVGKDGTSALPITTFGYGALSYVQSGIFWPQNGWNRLTSVNNGQGGALTFAYEEIGHAIGDKGGFINNYRVTSKTVNDGQGHAYSWSYSYGTPAYNTLGTALGWNDTHANPNSAALYYATYLDTAHQSDVLAWLTHPAWKEFRGHDYVKEIDPSGTITEHWFYQGESTVAGCPYPTNAGGGPAGGSGLLTNSCFQGWSKEEFRKGKEYLTRVSAPGPVLLSETAHTFLVSGVDYSVRAETGLWRAITVESQTDQSTFQPGTTTKQTHTTKTFYNTNCTADTDATLSASLGNAGCIQELDDATLVRKTLRYYLANTSAYIVDRMWGEAIYNSANQLVALTHNFYDGAASPSTAPTKGELTLVRRYYDIPTTCCTGVTLHGQDTGHVYDTYGNQTEVRTYPTAGTVSGTTYSAPGAGSTPRITATVYDSVFHALPIQQTNAVGHVTKAQYDERMGTLIRVTGPNSSALTPTDCSATSFSIPSTQESSCAVYDVFGRMVKLVKPGDSSASPSVQAIYHDTEQPFRYEVKQKDGSSDGVRTIAQFYDGLGQKIQTKAESDDGVNSFASVVTDTRYDGLGRVIAQSQPFYRTESSTNYSYTAPGATLTNQTTTTYDTLGRPLVITAPGGRKTEHHYGVTNDATLGLVSYDDVTTPERHRSQTWFDAFGRRVKVREFSGNCTNSYWMPTYQCGGAYNSEWAQTYTWTTSYSYNALDLLTSVTDAAGNTTNIFYDSLGRKTSMIDPDMGSWSYVYDTNGTLDHQTDAKGQIISFTYDNIDRLLTKSMPGNWVSTYAYDEKNPGGVDVFGKGKRTTITTKLNGAQQTYKRWEYNARGHTTLAGQSVSGVPTDLIYTYDSADRISTMRYHEANETVTYTYDAGGRPKRLCSDIAGQQCYVGSASYTALDQPDIWKLSGTTITRDANYSSPTARLSALSITAGATPILSRGYGYNNADNITNLTDSTPGSPLGNQTFGYDERDRLTSWTSALGTESYSYNAIGNITSKTGVGSYVYPTTGTAPRHAPSSVNGGAYTYDANGNTLTGGGRTFTWTPDNLVATVGGESYSYDADGERVVRTAGGVTTVYFEGVWEQTTTGARKIYYTFNGQTVAMRDSTTNAVSYLHGDHLGSVSASSDGSGGSISRQYFDPWGRVRSGGIGATSMNYTGQRLDATGLLYYHARYYNPVLARFVSADSVVPGSAALTATPTNADTFKAWNKGRMNTGPQNPQSLNRYSYTRNNPLKFIDPAGHEEQPANGGQTQSGRTVWNIENKQVAHELAAKVRALLRDLGVETQVEVSGGGQGGNNVAGSASVTIVQDKASWRYGTKFINYLRNLTEALLNFEDGQRMWIEWEYTVTEGGTDRLYDKPTVLWNMRFGYCPPEVPVCDGSKSGGATVDEVPGYVDRFTFPWETMDSSAPFYVGVRMKDFLDKYKHDGNNWR